MIKECITAAGITRVVWIDDYFAAPSREKLVELISETLFKLKEARYDNAPGFPEISLDQSQSSIATAVEDMLETKNDSEVAALFSGIKDIIADAESKPETQDDLSKEEFAALKKAFGSVLVTQSLQQWTSKGAETYSKAAEETLFLIDKEFTRESASYDGSELIADLVQRGEAFCILLTHRCSNAEEEELRRKEICDERKVAFHKFAVLSKRSGDLSEAVHKRFARAFSAVMMHRFTGDLAFTIAGALTKAVEDTATRLSKLSVYDLDRAVFVNSSREGVLEFDVLVRIFNSVERGALNKALCATGLQKSLKRIRGFAKTTRNFKANKPTVEPLKEFRQWRQNEVFESGSALNWMHAPLVCGDVFEIQGGRKQRFVLLGQACDLMIRTKRGERRASLGFLIEIKTLKTDALENGGKFPSVSTFDLDGVFGAEDVWRVDFRSKVIADLNVLDLAVFNNDGKLTLSKPHPEPDIALSEGWERRFVAIKKVFSSDTGRPRKLPLCVGTFSDTLKPTIRRGELSYPMARSGRLEGNTATAILAAWATFETRAALQHDFAAPEEQTVA